MLTSLIFAFGLLGISLIVIILVFRPYDYGADVQHIKKIGDGDKGSDGNADTRYRSVRVRPGLIACDRVAGISDQLFLSREAPELPLPNCTEANCNCHYVFLDDRRSGLDRRAEMAKLGKKLLPEFDRRRSPGRRAGDLLPV